jgi:hypothetical protein
MSHSNDFNKDNIDIYLNDFAENYKMLDNDNQLLKIVLVGGAAVLINYNFRKSTNDIDYSNPQSDLIDKAIEKTAEKYKLFKNWLNNDFRKTSAYSDKINEISIPYKQISDVLEVRTISPEYLIVMKLMAFRDNKHDLSDVAGILMECKENSKPLNIKDIKNAAIKLYGSIDKLPKESLTMLNNLFKRNDYKNDYLYLMKREEAVRNEYKELKKENRFDAETLDHKILLAKASNKINYKLEKYDDILLDNKGKDINKKKKY